MKKLQRIHIVLMYLVTLSALPITIIMRRHIGINAYGPWRPVPFGKGKGFYHAKWYTRIFVILLCHFWLKLYFILSVTWEEGALDINTWATWGWIINTFIYWPDHSIRSYGANGFFLFHSQFIVAVAFFQLIFSHELTKEKDRPLPGDLGDSIIFGRFIKDKYLVWGTIEPVLIFTVSIILSLYSHITLSIFIALAGAAILLQGQLMRQKLREDKGYLEGEDAARQKTLQLYESQNQFSKEEKSKETDDDDFAVL
jgi:hypothetical protein